MSGLLSQLEIARRALNAQQSALSVMSQNVANASTPGYTRQQALLGATDPMDGNPGQLGTGVSVTTIQRLRDGLTDVQVRHESASAGGWGVRDSVLKELSGIFGEPTDNGLSSALSNFFNSAQDLANHPQDASFKSAVMGQAQSVVDQFHTLDSSLKDLSGKVDSQISSSLDQVNQLTSQIATLNQQITDAESSGEAANDLRDRRDTALDTLSSLVNVSYDEHTAGAVTVRVGGLNLVEGNTSRTLASVSSSAGRVVLTAADGSTASPTGGQLQALQDLKDTSLADAQSKLDELAGSFAAGVNAVSSTGPHGSKIFAGTTAASLAVDPTTSADPTQLDAGTTAAAGDNSLALQLAGLQDGLTMSGGTTTFHGFYENLAGGAADSSSQATDLNQNHTLLLQQLVNQRDSVSGVNLDEEMTQILAAQKSYQAATQIVTTVDNLMTTVLNMVVQ